MYFMTFFFLFFFLSSPVVWDGWTCMGEGGGGGGELGVFYFLEGSQISARMAGIVPNI